MSLRGWLSTVFGDRLAVVYDEAYRLPLTTTEGGRGPVELRRADEALQYLLHAKIVRESEIVPPVPATFESLGLVHTPAYLDSLLQPATLATIFSVDVTDIVVDEVVRTARLAVGGTVEAARFAVHHRRPVFNLLGGFHHAAPDRGGGFCALNDIAVAIAQLRADGFTGRIAVLDVDFHPPDGTAACLGHDVSVWLGSLSGVSWGELPGVDETVLAAGTEDAPYLEALAQLVGRMPSVTLAFIIAGGDVLAGDPLGGFGLTLGGIRQRDLAIAKALAGVPQVWLPGGGYSSHAWKVVAGTALAAGPQSDSPIPVDYDPLASRLKYIASGLRRNELGEESLLTEADLADVLGMTRRPPKLLLGFYTEQGLELALERYRLLPLLRRLGFTQLRAQIDTVSEWDKTRLLGRDTNTGAEVTLFELEVARRTVASRPVLFINWLSLRNPRAQFSQLRPRLPGQEVPGLGLAREASTLMGLMAERLSLDGVAFQPSWYHMAYAARHSAVFVEPQRQGRFQALLRDLRDLPLVVATRAVADGKVLLNKEPYAWEAEPMVSWRIRRPDEEAFESQMVATRDASHFEVR